MSTAKMSEAFRLKPTILIALLGLLPSCRSATGNEPGWSDQERLEKRDVVCLGTVRSTEKVGSVDEHGDLYLAVVEVTGIKKGEEDSVGSKINVFYEAAKSGAGKRCPAYAKLAKGDKATFYLANMSPERQARLKIKSVKQPALFLEMGSDVRKAVEIVEVYEPGTISVRISSGSGDGTAVGSVFSIYRDNAPIGRLKITQVERDQSTASITSRQGVAKFEAGDLVLSDVTLQYLERLRPNSATKTAAQDGRMSADADVRRGLIRILYYGLPWSQGKPFIDDETGYPVTITDGCTVGKDFASFVNEYNLAMKQHFQKSASTPQDGTK